MVAAPNGLVVTKKGPVSKRKVNRHRPGSHNMAGVRLMREVAHTLSSCFRCAVCRMTLGGTICTYLKNASEVKTSLHKRQVMFWIWLTNTNHKLCSSAIPEALSRTRSLQAYASVITTGADPGSTRGNFAWMRLNLLQCKGNGTSTVSTFLPTSVPTMTTALSSYRQRKARRCWRKRWQTPLRMMSAEKL